MDKPVNQLDSLAACKDKTVAGVAENREGDRAVIGFTDGTFIYLRARMDGMGESTVLEVERYYAPHPTSYPREDALAAGFCTAAEWDAEQEERRANDRAYKRAQLEQLKRELGDG